MDSRKIRGEFRSENSALGFRNGDINRIEKQDTTG